MTREPRGWRAARFLYGGYFLAAGSWSLAAGTLYPPLPSLVGPGGRGFLDALDASGFVVPLASFSFLAGGAALLVPRLVPLGLLLLAPATAVIALFHLMLNGTWFVGLLFPLPLVALAWRLRANFRHLWS